MQFEAEEPINLRFAACGDVLEYLVALNAAIVTDTQRCGIHQADATARLKARTQVGAH